MLGLHSQVLHNDASDLLVVLGSLDRRDKRRIVTVVRVEDLGRVTVEQKRRVDEVQQDVSGDLAEV